MFCILGNPSGGSGQRCMCGFIGSHLKTKNKSARCDKSCICLMPKTNIFNNSPCGPFRHDFCRKLYCAPRRLRRRERFLNIFHHTQQKTKGIWKKNVFFPHFNEIIRCLSAFIFSLAKHICLSIETFQKTCFAMSYWISKKGSKLTIFSAVFLNIPQ